MASTDEKMSDNDIHNQENVSARSHSRQTRQQVRHRASVACSSCRDRRIRCVVPKGEAACIQCKRAGTACVIKNDDERRRPISKAYMSSLSERIKLLEGMLLNQGMVPPPAVHPPKTRQEEKEEKEGLDQERMASPPEFWGSLSTQEHPGTASEETSPESDHGLSEKLSPLSGQPGPGTKDIIQQLLSTNGNLSFEQQSGWLRRLPEQMRQSNTIHSLTPATQDYLMDCFWTYYNATISVIDQAAFEADRESQNPRFYSTFLYSTMLAMGFRFADHSRADIRKISVGHGGRESSLQREAKYMLDTELERSSSIPSIQAMLLLGDLECGVGRDNTGWMYASMANRLAMDPGLHLDSHNAGLPGPTDRETAVRLMVMKAVLVFDKYWALHLGRPTSIKSEDLRVDLLAGHLSGVVNSGQEIFGYLFELMELAGKIVDVCHRKTSGSEQSEPENSYAHIISLDRQLQNWYRHLPDHLIWKPANIKAAPMNFFLLHQQYHVCMILLHRSWARYGSSVGASEGHSPSSPKQQPGNASVVDDSRTVLSRSICTQQAVRVARIFWLHRQRFDGRRISVISLQHAATAAMALVAVLACQRNNTSLTDRRSYFAYLDILAAAITDMSHMYQPAARMNDLLRLLLQQLQRDQDHAVSDTVPTLYSVLPTRRGCPNSFESPSTVEKPCRASSSDRRASEFSRPPPPFFGTAQPKPAESVGSVGTTTVVSQPLVRDHFGLDLFSTPMDLVAFDNGPLRFCPPHASLSPVSLDGLDKAGEIGDRNHDLDFFRF